MKVKNDHRSKFSNLSNWKEEAWKKSGLQRDSNLWPPRYQCDALPTELWSHTLGARSIYWVHIFPCSEISPKVLANNISWWMILFSLYFVDVGLVRTSLWLRWRIKGTEMISFPLEVWHKSRTKTALKICQLFVCMSISFMYSSWKSTKFKTELGFKSEYLFRKSMLLCNRFHANITCMVEIIATIA